MNACRTLVHTHTHTRTHALVSGSDACEVCLRVRTHTHTHVYTRACPHTRVCTTLSKASINVERSHMCVCMSVYTRVAMRVYVCVSIHVWLCVNVCLCTCGYARVLSMCAHSTVVLQASSHCVCVYVCVCVWIGELLYVACIAAAAVWLIVCVAFRGFCVAVWLLVCGFCFFCVAVWLLGFCHGFCVAHRLCGFSWLLCGCVAARLWLLFLLCGYLASVWLCGCVAHRLCGSSSVWLFVASVWLCGYFVAVWLIVECPRWCRFSNGFDACGSIFTCIAWRSQ